MMKSDLPTINTQKQMRSPTITPQALAWDGKNFWMSSRDLGTLYRIDPPSRSSGAAGADAWKVVEEIDPPGVVWAATLTNDGWRLTIGKGLNDDRYIYRYVPNQGFTKLFACPDFTGSYLSFDGEHYYLSQWYTGLIHKVDDSGKIFRTMNVDAEICGHTFVDGTLYVLRGRENKDIPNKTEEWRIARLDPREEVPAAEDLATIPFAARSLTHDGEKFWSNHRAGNETISFTIPR